MDSGVTSSGMSAGFIVRAPACFEWFCMHLREWVRPRVLERESKGASVPVWWVRCDCVRVCCESMLWLCESADAPVNKTVSTSTQCLTNSTPCVWTTQQTLACEIFNRPFKGLWTIQQTFACGIFTRPFKGVWTIQQTLACELFNRPFQGALVINAVEDHWSLTSR